MKIDGIIWTEALIYALNDMTIGSSVGVGNGVIECRKVDGDYKCSGCAVVGSGVCNRIRCFSPNRVYKFIPKDNLGNLQGTDKEPDIIDRMNISYKRERFAFLSLIFAIGALGAIAMLTIIDLIRYAITVGVK